MKSNPFMIPLIGGGAVLALVGVLLTVMSLTGGYAFAPALVYVGALLLAIGGPALAGGLVLAGVDWRLTKGR
ncbi:MULTISPECIES: hypothetical protein [unclassified Microbacterium]|uniref:hypothetical protein n=1 Tax=unclassified Microbacterium TaxID=2609290 RepID=UPI003019DE36